jgi:hypothetical protein
VEGEPRWQTIGMVNGTRMTRADVTCFPDLYFQATQSFT